MIDELRANPEVLYGAGLALLIVVLLTPVVGNVARYLGIVDRPGERRVHERIVEARRARPLLRDHHPRARIRRVL